MADIIERTKHIKAALFDLDGVVFDTEGQYSEFWGGQCKLYYPDREGLEQTIKGQTLTQILASLFGDMPAEQERIVERLNAFEQHMTFEYIAGFRAFIDDLRRCGIKTAIVTSSNRAKMEIVYKARPELLTLFDAILTSEDFIASKPHPDCYLKAAARLGCSAEECLVFEDSLNGLRSGIAAGMTTVGLTTTHKYDDVAALSPCVIDDFRPITWQSLLCCVAMPNYGSVKLSGLITDEPG